MEGAEAPGVEACGVIAFRKGPAMRKFRLLLISVLLAFPVVGAGAAPAQACTSQFEPDGCAVVNAACRRFFGGNCLG